MSHDVAMRWSPRRAIIGVLAALSLAFLAWPASSTAETNTTFSGRAVALQGKVAGIQLPCLKGPAPPEECKGVVDTGPIAANSTEANLEASLLCYAVPDSTGCLLNPPNLTGNTLSAEALHAAVVARGNTSRAEASVADLSLDVAGQKIAAEALDARAQATCTGDGAVVKAGAETSVTINGTTYKVAAGEERTVRLLDGLGVDIGYVVINQGASGPKEGTAIDASALHVVIPAADTDVTVAAVHADVVCGKSLDCPGQQAFVTGGGYIGGPDGAKQHFAVAGRNLQRWGHVMWKPTRLHVKDPYGLVFDDLGKLKAELKGHQFKELPSSITSEGFEGAAILSWYADDGSLIGEALAVDRGEPGRDVDYLELVDVSTTPAISLGAGFLKGGNVQMHGKCVS